MPNISIGNDIVDLNDPQAQEKYHNPNFLKRICAPHEIMLVHQAKDPQACLWGLWAIKEASYKALQKQSREIKFIPNQFLCQFKKKVFWGCSHKELHCQVMLTTSEEYVHAIAVAGEGSLWNDVSSQVSHITVDDDNSEAVRQLAVELLAQKGYSHAVIHRHKTSGKLQPPKAFVNEIPIPHCDLSLSHDGRFIAAAIHLTDPTNFKTAR